MNNVTLAAFMDEMEKIAAPALLRQGADLLRKGWHAGGARGHFGTSGWFGEGAVHGGGVLDKVVSLGGLTKHLPVGPKALTVAGTAAMAPNAVAKEDASGQGKSRAERVGGLIGGTVGGLGAAGITNGLIGGVIGGVGGEAVGSRIGRAISGRKPVPQAAPQAVPQQIPPQNIHG